jgi:hypothetical protein
MPITLVATPGAETANTFGTLEEADAYFASRVDATDWAAAGEEARKAALVSAATRLTECRFAGRRTYEDQALAFPRSCLNDEDGFAVGVDTIPARVKRGQFEQAFTMLTSPGSLEPTGLEQFTSLKAGAIELEMVPRAPAPGALSEAARRALEPFLVSGTPRWTVAG